ncbi:MAG: ferric reductase-like transmembrane domain-containing protein [Pseudomonadota bacterium]
MSRARMTLVWAVLACALVVPIAAAAVSPQLAWRDPIYIAAGFAGVVAMSLMLVQPLLIGRYLPGIPSRRYRQIHRGIGGVLVALVAIHVAGLWITSPPDVIDALLFDSPTPFSAWGVIAMWAIFITGFLAMLRKPLRIRPGTWRIVHTTLAAVIVVGSVVHAVQIEGTMETVSKVALCGLILIATVKVVADLRVWTLLHRRAG